MPLASSMCPTNAGFSTRGQFLLGPASMDGVISSPSLAFSPFLFFSFLLFCFVLFCYVFSFLSFLWPFLLSMSLFCFICFFFLLCFLFFFPLYLLSVLCVCMRSRGLPLRVLAAKEYSRNLGGKNPGYSRASFWGYFRRVPRYSS